MTQFEDEIDVESIIFKSEDPVRLVRSVLPNSKQTLTIQTYPDHEKATGRPATGQWDGEKVTAAMRRANADGCAVAWRSPAWHADIDGLPSDAPAPNLPIEPTAVVRSKNGYHIYYGRNGVDTDAGLTMRGICIAVRGDPAVARDGHWLRLPGFKHQKDPAAPFDVSLILESGPLYSPEQVRCAFPVPTDDAWVSYTTWYAARKMGVVAGDFGSEEWEKNRKAVVAFTQAVQATAKYKGQLRSRIDWMPGRSPDYWWGFVTWARLVEACRRYSWDVAIKSLDPAEWDPSTPEWLANVERKARFWLAYVAQKETEAGDHQVSVKPFDPAQISEEDALHAPKMTRKGTGIPLRRLDVIGVCRRLGLEPRQDGSDKYIIKCPWCDRHSDPTKDEAAVWSASSLRGAGFHCFHSSCQGRTVLDLVELAGGPAGIEDFVDGGMTEIAGITLPYGKPDWPAVYPPENKKLAGLPLPQRIENTRAMLRHYRIVLRRNLMTKEVEYDVGMSTTNGSLALIYDLARRWGLSVAAVTDHLRIILDENEYHPVADWIRSKPWDGINRFDDLVDTVSLEPGYDRELWSGLLRLWLCTAAACALRKDVQTQGMLVVQGPENTGKTQWLLHLVPPETRGFWAVDGLLLNPADKDSVHQATGHWLVELGELDATFRRTDIAALKAFVTRLTDEYRCPYERTREKYPRRTALYASVNRSDILADDTTGNRRFWVVRVQKCNFLHEIDLQQLWAQAAHYVFLGEKLWLSKDLSERLRDSNEEHRTDDPIYDALTSVVTLDITGRNWTKQSEIVEAVKHASDLSSWGQRESRAVTAGLRRLTGQRKGTKRTGIYYWPVSISQPQSAMAAYKVLEDLVELDGVLN